MYENTSQYIQGIKDDGWGYCDNLGMARSEIDPYRDTARSTDSFNSCYWGGPSGISEGPKQVINGVNLVYPYSEAGLAELIAHKPKVVRIPVRYRQRKQQWQTAEKLKKNGILPHFVFDIGAGSRLWKKQIDSYVNEWKAEVVWELGNEVWAMRASPGYFRFTSELAAFNYINKWIDYIHARIGPTSVMNAGIANVFEEIETGMLELFITRGHQDILSIHVYNCKASLIANKVNLISKWKKPIWVTEIGTQGDKDAFLGVCPQRVSDSIPVSAMLWYNFNGETFGIKETRAWGSLF